VPSAARIFAITLRINGAAAPLMPLFGIACLIELVTGTLIVIGFRAAIPAFYCFVFLCMATCGTEMWQVNSAVRG
jgi:uncharacterized membrane protein YphA (DoxX/SURF4 family)